MCYAQIKTVYQITAEEMSDTIRIMANSYKCKSRKEENCLDFWW